MNWIITRDHICENLTRWSVSRVGTRGLNTDPKADMPFQFRIYDDDGILYYEGLSDEEEFEPLDWAMHDAGATAIHYKQPNGGWAQL